MRTRCLALLLLVVEAVWTAPSEKVLAPSRTISRRRARSAGEPPSIQETDPIVTAAEANYVILKCNASGNPSPSITWAKGSYQIDGSGSRHKLLENGSLQINNLYKSDAGTYTCTAENNVGDPARKDIVLELTDPSNQPAAIIDEENTIIITSLGAPVELHCHAVGFPRPSITWWRGDRMLPLSTQVYEQSRDFSLLIRSVTLRSLGPYTCQAYNGLGRAAYWTVTVKAVGPVYTIEPSDTVYTNYLISPHDPQPPQPPAPHRPFYPPRQPDPPPVTEPPRVYRVPVEANITLSSTIFPVGSDISIPCDVSGFPLPQVQWFKDNLLLEAKEKIKVTESHRLLILQANASDAGLYRCEAVNEHGSSSSSITIKVEGIHANCTDNPFFANCKLIALGKYCTHVYYSRLCCKTCTQAGQLPVHKPLLESPGVLEFGCKNTEFGCCSDEKTSATGPELSGCDCAASKYGCCKDGITSAKGETFEGCEDNAIAVIEQHICTLPAEIGNCYNYTERWYYNVYIMRCTPFYYGGCNGNGNNFPTLQDCQQRCESIATSPSEQREFCFQSKDDGPCSDFKAQWYYDSEDGVCKQFLYGGCQGNQNRFSSLNDCEGTCGNAQDICQLPRVVGPCIGNYRQWYYDKTAKECLEFDYGGCQGNGNRFDYKQQCEVYCKGDSTSIGFITTQAPDINETYSTGTKTALRVEEGSYVTLKCDAFENQSLSVRWEKNSFQIDDSGSRYKLLDDVSLQIINLFKEDAGIYTCTAVNDVGDVSQEDIILEVTDPTNRPAEIIGEQNKTVLATMGISKRLYCPAVGWPRPLITWWHGDHILPVFSREYLQGSDSSLLIQKVTLRHLGPFTCEAYNGHGNGSSWTAILKTIAPVDYIDLLDSAYAQYLIFPHLRENLSMHPSPTSSQPPSSSSTSNYSISTFKTDSVKANSTPTRNNYTAGSNISLPCDVSGFSLPQVQWYKNKIPLEYGDKIQKAESHHLIISQATRGDSGLYQCKVTNDNGSYTTSIFIEVEDKITNVPAEILDEDNKTIIASLGKPVFLRCHAWGRPSPRITWWRGGHMLPLSNSAYEQGRDFSLLIRSVTLSTLGPYTCQAYNGVGKIISWTVIVKAFGPDFCIAPEDSAYTQYLIFPYASTTTTTTTTTTDPGPSIR